ncbi:Fructose 1,6-bisphosphatase class 2 [Rickettsiales endosymbiont of Paramecium tredecaurelia]|uniref:fructose-bisphosphatase class II n=1 Tax=Candidatus Sarmatiella mevalonica TaxID=2770581 RepID=UPI0019249C69|nr:fructose-bisphosphatase class II [Candidatus Sarmatiella mevalonica]MBL3284593.1 Fructose 1,6-bisphosphatase class 2 [Candidatus Sarmatiella mevalonica]
MYLVSNLEDFFVRTTCLAAMSVHKVLGLEDAMLADKMAVDAIFDDFTNLPFDIRIIAGEGERDKAPMLYLGQEFAHPAADVQKQKFEEGGIMQLDVAIDPLECTTNAAFAKNGAMSVLAVGARGCMMALPDVYMQKIVTHINAQAYGIDLDNSIEQNISILANVLMRTQGKERAEIKVVILDRPRHSQIIERACACGVDVILITDGDVEASLLVAQGMYHMYIGSGGAVEGLLSAAAIKAIGGSFCGRLVGDGEYERKKYNIYDLVPGDVIFVSTAITDNALMKGLTQDGDRMIINSLVLNTQNESIRRVQTALPII